MHRGILVALGLAAVVQAQELRPEALRVIDSALALLGMARHDLWLPGDITPADSHRLAEIAALFQHPLQVFSMLSHEARHLLQLRPAVLDEAARRWFRSLAMEDYSPRYYEQQLSARQLDSLLGVNLEQRVGLIAATSLRQYLGPLVLAWKDIEAIRRSIRELPFLVEVADTLLLLSEEDAEASLFELKAREEAARKRAERFFAAAAAVPWGRLLAPMVSLWRALWATVERNSPPLDRYRDSIRTTVFETPFGRIAIGGPGDDVYVGDFTFILDVGGNDRYMLPPLTKAEALARPVRVIIDLSGDDLYVGDDFAFGAGFFGCGFLIDLQGNDLYRARHFSQGAAIAGLGVLWDGAGYDRYVGGIHVQGAAAFGLGMLIDRGGHDLYQCQAQGQGFGFVRGYGALVDHSGNDVYLAQSPYVDVLRYEHRFVTFAQGAALGYRPLASGGIGLLLDSAGNDTYLCDIYGQGTGYWYGLGAVLDWAGHDRYVAYQYAQGAGVHLAFGLLWDEEGEDIYSAHGVSQGCGHDFAVGILYDAAGDDHYLCESLSQGAASANGLALLVDLHGNDTYAARRPNTMGFGDYRRHFGSLGLFLDAEGTDWYADTVGNRWMRLQSTYGVLFDGDLVPPLPPPPRLGIDVPDTARMPLAESLDSLFVQASAAPQKFQYIVQPARERIAALGAAAIPFLARKLATESARERLALEEILPRLDAVDSAALRRLVLDSLRSDNERTLALMATVAGRLRLREAVPALQILLQDRRWTVRAMAALRLGEIGDSAVQEQLRQCLEDPHPLVRARAAHALVRLQPRQPLAVWARMLGDSCAIVRAAALQGAQQRGNLPIALVEELWRLPLQPSVRGMLGWIVNALDTTVSLARLERLLARQPSALRRTAYAALAAQPSTSWAGRVLRACLRRESDPSVVPFRYRRP